MRFQVYHYLISFLIFATSCSRKEAAGTLPILLEIDRFSLQSKNSIDDSKITGAWCFLDDDFIGYYPLPNTIPIFTQASTTLRLLPGIYANGIAATPEDYPFYQAYEFTLTPSIFTSVSITPLTTYKEEVKFSLLENFENGQTYFTKPLNESSIDHFKIQQEMVIEGKYAAKIELNQENHPNIEIATSKKWSRATIGQKDVYLEVQYQTAIPVIFGLVGFTSFEDENGFPLYQYGVNPTENWNKIYFKLDELLVDSNIQAYSICLSANLEGTGLTTADIYLDNIKLIHF